MMKKMFFLVVFTAPFFIKAQVNINAQLPPGGLVQKDQLWNLVIANSKSDILDVSIKMNLQDAVTGQIVLSASTGNILIGKGVKVITIRDVQPVMYSYNVQELSRTYLPMGTYVACYRLVKNGEGQESLGEDCININIDPLSPPLLNTPPDKSDILTPYPQFSWMPPAPFDMFNNLSYDLLVTEVLPNQNANEAIQYNTPIYSRSNINQPYETYASSFTKLDTGRLYAWQVIAKNGGNYSAKTEVWTFTIPKNPIEKRVATNTYVSLRNSTDDQNIYYLKEDKLSIRFYSFDKDFVANIKIMTTDYKIVDEMKQKIIYGDNFFNLKLGKNVRNKQLYLIQLVGKDGIKNTALFSLKN